MWRSFRTIKFPLLPAYQTNAHFQLMAYTYLLSGLQLLFVSVYTPDTTLNTSRILDNEVIYHLLSLAYSGTDPACTNRMEFFERWYHNVCVLCTLDVDADGMNTRNVYGRTPHGRRIRSIEQYAQECTRVNVTHASTFGTFWKSAIPSEFTTDELSYVMYSDEDLARFSRKRTVYPPVTTSTCSSSCPMVLEEVDLPPE